MSCDPNTCADPSFLNFVSQISHVLAGMLIILGPIALVGPKYMWQCAFAFLLFAAIKEFWYDYNFETAAERGSSMEDFCFYVLGVFIAIALYQIKLKITH